MGGVTWGKGPLPEFQARPLHETLVVPSLASHFLSPPPASCFSAFKAKLETGSRPSVPNVPVFVRHLSDQLCSQLLCGPGGPSHKSRSWLGKLRPDQSDEELALGPRWAPSPVIAPVCLWKLGEGSVLLPVGSVQTWVSL